MHLSAIFGAADAHLGVSAGGQTRAACSPLSPCLAGYLCQAVFPGALALAKVTVGLGAAGGRVLEITAFPAPRTTS